MIDFLRDVLGMVMCWWYLYPCIGGRNTKSMSAFDKIGRVFLLPVVTIGYFMFIWKKSYVEVSND